EPAEFITIRDMSEQKQIEEERKKSEKRYQELFDSILEGIGVVDENEVVQFCNPAFLKIFEVDSEEIIVGKNLLDFIPDKQKKTVLAQTKKRMMNISSHYEMEIITPSGNKKSLYVSSSPRFDKSGKYIGAFGAVIDLTEQKKAVDDLLQSEQFNKAVIEHSPLGVSVRSRTGKLLGYNKTWREIWGFTDEEIKEFTDRERTELKFDEYDDYLGKKLPDLKRIYTDGGYLHISDIHTPKARSRTTNLWVSQHFYAIKDASGNVERVVILTEDITERKTAEQKIKVINTEKLIQAKRIAGTFAHEIRNALFPATASLNRIKLSSQSSKNDKEELKKYTLIAERSITRAADITGLISSYTKLDTEQMPERVNINEIVKELLNNNQLRLLENKVAVNTTGGNNCLIMSNRRQLLLAFNNLLLNSIDAMVEKGKTDENNKRKINIQWFSNDDCCNISFEDNGCGIRTEYLGRIFEAFFSQKSESGGTGIGLAMTKRIIEMYGGAISVKSVFGAGTTFNINLKNYTANTVDKNNNLE
ncbi:MAG: PAS domain S-box protein, partial [candidate division Zixibacteria bacterium]|nr:PAS domain S-box protein [candidate division Zixibacteria bacterium]